MATYTKKEFAQVIKQKYPAYKDWDDDYLTEQVLNKYPVYQSWVEKEPSLFGKVFEKTKETAKTIFKEPAPSKYKTPAEIYADYPNLINFNKTLKSFEEPETLYDGNLAEMKLKSMLGKKPTDVLSSWEIANKWMSPADNEMFSEKAPAIKKEREKLVTYLTQGKLEPDDLWDKIRKFLDPPEATIAKAQNIYYLSKVTNLPFTEVEKHYNEIVREVIDVPNDIAIGEFGKTAGLTGLIAMGLATHPVATVAGLGTYMLLDYLIPTETFISVNAGDTEKSLIELADFIVKGAVIGGLGKLARPIKNKLVTKYFMDKAEEYKMPKTIRMSREQMREFFTGGQFSNPERDAIIKDLNLSHEQLTNAVLKGVEVEIPAEKIITMTDKPYWAKFKSLWGAKPDTQVIKEYADAVKYRDYTPYLEYKPELEVPKKPIPEEVKIEKPKTTLEKIEEIVKEEEKPAEIPTIKEEEKTIEVPVDEKANKPEVSITEKIESIPETNKPITEETPELKPLESLAEEAKKYKSAEELAKAIKDAFYDPKLPRDKFGVIQSYPTTLYAKLTNLLWEERNLPHKPYWEISSLTIGDHKFNTYQEAKEFLIEKGFNPPEDFQPGGYFEYEPDISTRIIHFADKKAKKVNDWIKILWENYETDPKGKNVYVRYGKIPTSGFSTNGITGESEKGVSVYNARLLPDGKVIIKVGSNIELASKMFIEASNRPLYLVEGKKVGTGSDGEPVLSDAKIIKKVEVGTIDDAIKSQAHKIWNQVVKKTEEISKLPVEKTEKPPEIPVVEKPKPISESIIKEIPELKPEVSISKFLPKDKNRYITKQGEYSNGIWMLKPEFTPEKVKKKIEENPTSTSVDSTKLWPEEKLNPVSEIKGYVPPKFGWNKDSPTYIVKSVEGTNIAINKHYYDYLNENIPDFNLKIVENTTGKDKLVIYSGDEKVGLLMPLDVNIEERNDDVIWLPNTEEKKVLTTEPVQPTISEEGYEKENTQLQVNKEGQSEIRRPERPRPQTVSGTGEGTISPLSGIPAQRVQTPEENRGTSVTHKERSEEYPRGERPDLPTVTERGIAPAASDIPSRPTSSGTVVSSPRRGISETTEERISTSIPRRNCYHITPEDAIGQGTPLEKFDYNINAIKTLKKILAEQRFATPEEQAILVKYTGWGAMPEVFDRWNKEPAKQKRYELVKSLLSEEEWESASRSVSNAHYTSFEVINAMYSIIDKFGFNGGRILEPSVGVGHFIGLMKPEMLANSSLMAVELDHLTGQIAKQLYQTVDMKIKGFQDVVLPNNYFDLVIGNIPFGDFSVFDPEYKNYKFLIHDYFLAKSIDKTRPGGINILITSHGTLDKVNSSVRRYLSERADLIGAIRLPRTAFKETAGTEVTTDILILQKRKPGQKPKDASWIETVSKEINGETLGVNKYFETNKDMILGVESVNGLGRYTVEPTSFSSLEDMLKKAIEKLPADIYIPETNPVELPTNKTFSIADKMRKGRIVVKEGKVIQKVSEDEAKEIDITKKEDIERIKAISELGDKFLKLVEIEKNPKISDEEVKNEIEKFSKDYDNFTKKYGLISDKKNEIFNIDPLYPVLKTFDKLDPATNKYVKSDIFTRRVITPEKKIEKVATAIEALNVSLAEKNKVDLDRISELTGKNVEDIKTELSGLIFNDPEKGWVTREEYLSGNVKKKLAIAMSMAENDISYKQNVEALKAVQPVDLKPGEIHAALGSAWIPTEYIRDFINYLCKARLIYRQDVSYDKFTSTWYIRRSNPYSLNNNVANTQTWGLPEVDAVDIIEKTLNGKFPVVKRKVGEDLVIDHEKTALAREKQSLIKEEFSKWIWDIKDETDKQRVDDLLKIYNDNFNNLIPRKYNGQHLTTFPGMNPNITLTPSQKDAVWRILQSPNTLLAMEVGGGKTFTMITAGMEMRRLGIRRKIMYVFPNHLLKNWQDEFLRLYPTAKILVPTRADFKAENRKQLMGKIITGDWDAILIPQSQFGMFSVSDKTIQRYFEQQIQELKDTIDALRREHGDYRSQKMPTVKQMQSKIRKLEAKLKTILDKSKKTEIGLTFEDTGVDQLFVDEAQDYKNLLFVTKKQAIAGINGTNSGRASDMFMKVRHIQDMNNGGGVVFATGTPIANSIAEMYTLLNYLYPNGMIERGLYCFDSWADTFGEVVTSLETNVTGKTLRTKTSFSKFANIPEMWNMFLDFAMPLSKEDMKLKVPKIKGGKPTVVKLPKTQDLENYINSLVDRVEKIQSRAVDPSADNMLKVTNDGGKAALDIRLVNLKAGDNPDSKVNKAVENIYRIWQDTADKKLTQLVFCDLSIPKQGFNVYDDIKQKLINLGVPKEEIAFIHDYKREDLSKLADKMNAGQVRILLSSTQKGGTGLNIQKKLYALHHLDVPWEPWRLEQREGRIIRQGNENPEVEIYRYVVEGSFDVYKLQTIERKVKGFGNLLYGKFKGRDFEDVLGKALTAEEVKAIATGNPLIMQRVSLSHEWERLNMLKTAYVNNKVNIQMQIAENASKIEYWKSVIPRLTADLEALKLVPEKFSMEINGKVYDKREEAGKAINDAFKTLKSGERIEIGTYKGFPISVLMSGNGVLKVIAKGQIAYEGNVFLNNPEGTLKSLDYNFSTKRIEERIKSSKELVTQYETQNSDLKKELDKPFEHDKELTQTTKELIEVNKKLGINNAELGQEGGRGIGDEEEQADVTDEVTEEFETETDRFEKSEGRKKWKKSADMAIEASGKGEEEFKQEIAKKFNKIIPESTTPPSNIKEIIPTIDLIKPAELPELVKLVENITGKPPMVKKLRKSLGKLYYEEGSGEIKIVLDRRLWADPYTVSAVLGHEIGHLCDFLPDYTLARGNLLGRLFSLKKYLKHTYGETDIKNKEIKEELKALSKWWRPYDEKSVSDNYISERNSPAELYADAVSILLNSPKHLEEKAPKFWKLFFDNLDNKPEILKEFTEIWDLYHLGQEEIAKIRFEDLHKAYARGEEIIKLKMMQKHLINGSGWEWARIALENVFHGVIKKVDELEAQGITFPDYANPKFQLTRREMVYNDIAIALGQIDEEVTQPLMDIGITKDDIGDFLVLKRILFERKDIPNPKGYTPDTAQFQLDMLRAKLGEEKWRILEQKMAIFHEIVFRWSQLATEVGLYSKKAFEETIVPNKDVYATFAVLDYLQDYISKSLHAQVGTLKDIANPFLTTQMKLMSMIRGINQQMAVNSVRDMLLKYFPDEIEKAEAVKTPDGITLYWRKSNNSKLTGQLEMFEDGKKVAYNVSPTISVGFNKSVTLVNATGRILDLILGKKLFHALFVEYNIGFMGWNILRDLFDNIILNPDIPITDILASYVKSLPEAHKRALGEMTPLLKEMLSNRAIGLVGQDFTINPDDDAYTILLKRYLGKDEKENTKKLLSFPIQLFAGIRHVGATIEGLGKIAVYQARRQKMIENGQLKPNELGYKVNIYSGTPPYQRKGLITPISNSIFMYSNVMIQGLSRTIEVATNPKTRSGAWWRLGTFSLLKILMRLAAIGVAGKLLKDFYDRISEHDKTHYICLPLGIYPGGNYKWKAVYMTIPPGYTMAFPTALAWKLSGTYSNEPRQLQQMLDITADQLPNISPGIKIMNAWHTFLTGRNPYDEWKDRRIIPDIDYKAGTWPALKSMVYWTIDQSGQLRVSSYNKTEDTTVEVILKATPLINRFIRISDYGMVEKEKWFIEEQEQEKAQLKLARSDKERLFLSRLFHLKNMKNASDTLPLEQREASFSKEQSREYYRLSNFYYNAYLPLQKNIKIQADKGNVRKVEELNKILKQRVENIWEKRKKW